MNDPAQTRNLPPDKLGEELGRVEATGCGTSLVSSYLTS